METAAQLQPANRRESLYYLWTASILLITVLLAALLFWFMRQPLTIPSKIVPIELAKIPPSGSLMAFPTYRFWLAHTDDDALIALAGYEPKFGCLVKWVATNHRFEDPCYGYKAKLSGTYIEGQTPAHDLDRYFMTITFANGQTVSSNVTGDPIALEGRAVTAISIDVCRLIEGKRYVINSAAYAGFATQSVIAYLNSPTPPAFCTEKLP
jgi:hypothetical protein